MRKYDVCIVGAGPSGIFTAIELIRLGSKKKMRISYQITDREKTAKTAPLKKDLVSFLLEQKTLTH